MYYSKVTPKALLINENEVIDVDAMEDTAMDKVYQWDCDMKQMLLDYIDVDNQYRLETLVKAYIKSLTTKARFLTDYYSLIRKITGHIQTIDFLYRNISPQNEDNYLDLMEDVLAIYCCLLTKHLIDISPNQRQVKCSCRGLKNILVKFLLNKFDHIFNTLIKTEVDYKEIVNKIMFSNVTKHFLHIFKSTIDRRDLQMYARIYVLFQKWKVFQDKSKHHILDEALSIIYNRKSEWILHNQELTTVLMPMFECGFALRMHLLTSNEQIFDQLFDYFKKCRKEKNEDEIIIIDDNETEEDIAFRGLEDVPDTKFRKVSSKFEKLGGRNEVPNDQVNINSTVLNWVKESQVYADSTCIPDVFAQYRDTGLMRLSQMVELYTNLSSDSSLMDDDLGPLNVSDVLNFPSTSRTLTTAESVAATEENDQSTETSSDDSDVEYVRTYQCTNINLSTLISNFSIASGPQETLAQDSSLEILEQTEEQNTEQILMKSDYMKEKGDTGKCGIAEKSTEQKSRHIEEQCMSCDVDIEKLTFRNEASIDKIDNKNSGTSTAIKSHNLTIMDTNEITLIENNSEISNGLSNVNAQSEQTEEQNTEQTITQSDCMKEKGDNVKYSIDVKSRTDQELRYIEEQYMSCDLDIDKLTFQNEARIDKIENISTSAATESHNLRVMDTNETTLILNNSEISNELSKVNEEPQQNEEQNTEQTITQSDCMTEQFDNVIYSFAVKSRTEQELRHIEDQCMSCDLDIEKLTFQSEISKDKIENKNSFTTSAPESHNLGVMDTNEITLILNISEVSNGLSNVNAEPEQTETSIDKVENKNSANIATESHNLKIMDPNEITLILNNSKISNGLSNTNAKPDQTEEQGTEQTIIQSDCMKQKVDNVKLSIAVKSRTEQKLRHIEEQYMSCELDDENTFQNEASIDKIDNKNSTASAATKSHNLRVMDTNEITLIENNSEISNKLSNINAEEQCESFLQMNVPTEQNHLEISVEENPNNCYCERLNNGSFLQMNIPTEQNHLEISVEENPNNCYCERLSIVHQDEAADNSDESDIVGETSVAKTSEEKFWSYVDEEEFNNAFNSPLAKSNIQVHVRPNDNFVSRIHSTSSRDDGSPIYESTRQNDFDFQSHYSKSRTFIPENIFNDYKSESYNSIANSVCNWTAKVNLDQQLSKQFYCCFTPIYSILKNTPILNLASFNKWLVHPMDPKLNMNCQVVINKLSIIEIRKWKTITEMVRRGKSQKLQEIIAEMLDFQKPIPTTYLSVEELLSSYSIYDDDTDMMEETTLTDFPTLDIPVSSPVVNSSSSNSALNLTIPIPVLNSPQDLEFSNSPKILPYSYEFVEQALQEDVTEKECSEAMPNSFFCNNSNFYCVDNSVVCGDNSNLSKTNFVSPQLSNSSNVTKNEGFENIEVTRHHWDCEASTSHIQYLGIDEKFDNRNQNNDILDKTGISSEINLEKHTDNDGVLSTAPYSSEPAYKIEVGSSNKKIIYFSPEATIVNVTEDAFPQACFIKNISYTNQNEEKTGSIPKNDQFNTILEVNKTTVKDNIERTLIKSVDNEIDRKKLSRLPFKKRTLIVTHNAENEKSEEDIFLQQITENHNKSPQKQISYPAKKMMSIADTLQTTKGFSCPSLACSLNCTPSSYSYPIKPLNLSDYCCKLPYAGYTTNMAGPSYVPDTMQYSTLTDPYFTVPDTLNYHPMHLPWSLGPPLKKQKLSPVWLPNTVAEMPQVLNYSQQSTIPAQEHNHSVNNHINNIPLSPLDFPSTSFYPVPSTSYSDNQPIPNKEPEPLQQEETPQSSTSFQEDYFPASKKGKRRRKRK